MPRTNSVSFGELLTALNAPLSPDELQHVSQLSIAIAHAMTLAESMPASLDARSRSLVIQKLQEAEHWLIETVRESLP